MDIEISIFPIRGTYDISNAFCPSSPGISPCFIRCYIPGTKYRNRIDCFFVDRCRTELGYRSTSIQPKNKTCIRNGLTYQISKLYRLLFLFIGIVSNSIIVRYAYHPKQKIESETASGNKYRSDIEFFYYSSVSCTPYPISNTHAYQRPERSGYRLWPPFKGPHNTGKQNVRHLKFQPTSLAH